MVGIRSSPDEMRSRKVFLELPGAVHPSGIGEEG